MSQSSSVSLLPYVSHVSKSLFLDQELISYSYTHLVVLLIAVLVLVGATLLKKTQSSVVSNGIGMKFNTIILQVNTHRLTESDF